MIIKTYAPVIIPTLCRYEHFKRCLDSLERCTGADKTDVYVGLDFPPSEKYVDGWKKIDEYLKEKEANNNFKSLTVYRRDHNYGIYGVLTNGRDLYNKISQKYDRYISSEDDNEFSPNFLEFINQCLEKYKDDPDVIMITGYTYPIEWKTSENATVVKQNICASMWGTGNWVNKVSKVSTHIKNGAIINSLKHGIKSRAYRKMIDAAKIGYFTATCEPRFIHKRTLFLGCSDVAVRCYMPLYDKYIISPVVSLVRNYGFDGTGAYCQQINDGTGNTAGTYNYTKQPIDTSSHFEIIEDTLNAEDTNSERLNAFDYRSPEQMKRTNLFIYLAEHFGAWAPKAYYYLLLPFDTFKYFKNKYHKER